MEIQPKHMRILSIILFLISLVGVFNYPLQPYWLFGAMIVYGMIIYNKPLLAVFFIPILLPVLNFAPLTGWLFINEFDLFYLLTIGIYYWKDTSAVSFNKIPKFYAVVVALIFLSITISTLLPIIPFQSLDLNSFSNYNSGYNSLRKAKFFIELILFFPIFFKKSNKSSLINRYFLSGILIGLFLVSLIGIWEKMVFTGLFNFSDQYRLTSTFPEMHTGGAFIDGYLALTMPFIYYFFTANRPVYYLIGTVFFLLALFITFITMSRIVYLSLGISFLVFFVGFLRYSKKKIRSFCIVLLLIITIFIIATPIIKGDFLQRRFGSITSDIGIRLTHWENAIEKMNPGILTILFGMGFNTYPRAYFDDPDLSYPPADYKLFSTNNNTYLYLTAGDSIYFGQIISLSNQNHRLKLKVRSRDPKSVLIVTIREKSILHAFKYKWLTINIGNTNGQWVSKNLEITDVEFNKNKDCLIRPIVFELYNDGHGRNFDVDDIQLLNQNGTNIIQNGHFTKGTNNWFFYTENHLPWHIKNIWVSLLFEQGLLGVILFVIVLFLITKRLVTTVSAKNMLPLAFLASIYGFLTIGLIDSLFDSARISLLFFMVLSISVLPMENNTFKLLKRH